ncbi:MAG: PKD domain-containing protein, partial [Candidatus Bathyarchaeia archaeon]
MFKPLTRTLEWNRWTVQTDPEQGSIENPEGILPDMEDVWVKLDDGYWEPSIPWIVYEHDFKLLLGMDEYRIQSVYMLTHRVDADDADAGVWEPWSNGLNVIESEIQQQLDDIFNPVYRHPVASFTYEPSAPYVGDSVAFNASSSYDPDRYIASYDWDFGDGTSDTGMVVTHTYSTDGVYTVALTVTDDEGLTDTAIADVTVRHCVLTIKLSGEHDYLYRERIRIRIAALVRGSTTMEPVSNANVTLAIYDPAGNLWVSAEMEEMLDGTGIYEWQSDKTIQELMQGKYSVDKLEKGIYLAYARAAFKGGPVATDILEFHIDPPLEEPIQLHTILLAVIVGALVTVISGWLIYYRRLARKRHQLGTTA